MLVITAEDKQHTEDFKFLVIDRGINEHIFRHNQSQHPSQNNHHGKSVSQKAKYNLKALKYNSNNNNNNRRGRRRNS